jgi:hypothetical protein
MHCSRVDAFRHRAAPIIADHAAVSYCCRLLTLTGSTTQSATSKKAGFAGEHDFVGPEAARPD